MAYLVGLLTSDGCLIGDGRHIALTSKDIDIIQMTQTILHKEHLKIGTKIGQFKTSTYQFQFADAALYDFLILAGITPAKSKTIQSVDLPDEYYFAFLRGHFDGDGTIYGYIDPRWNKSYMYYTSFASASPNFLVWLDGQNARLIGTSPGKIQSKTRVHTLTYAKKNSRLIFHAMYHNRPAYKLTRKYDKFMDFITSDSCGKITPVRASGGMVDTHA